MSIFAVTGVSGAAAPAMAGDIVPPVIYSVTPTGVNLSDRTFTYTQTDLAIGSLSLERFHLSGLHDPNSPLFGLHMSNNFDIYVAEREVTLAPWQYYRAIVHMGNTASSTYDVAYNVTPTYVSPFSDDAQAGSLELVGSAYVYTDQSGTIYTFDPSVSVNGAPGQTQRVANIVYPNGRKLTFSYDSGKMLKLVTDSTGYAILFDNSGGTVSAACGFDLAQSYVTTSSTCSSATLKTGYAYSSGMLTAVTDVNNQVTTYGYQSTGEISCITPPGYTTCKISNTYVGPGSIAVSQQTLADGSIWQYWSDSDIHIRDPDYVPDDDSSHTSVTDPNGKVWGYSFVRTSPASKGDPNGNVTTYQYTGGTLYDSTLGPTANGTMLVEADLPEGNKYLATYGRYNVRTSQTWKAKPGSGLADRTESITLPSSCTTPYTRQNCVKPLTATDSNGNVTNFAYTSWGGLLSEMQSAPTSGAARPLKLYDYVQKYAYVKNSGGALVASATPVWLPNSETDCQTVAGSSTPTCDSAAPQVVTTYQYGANGTADNLLLRGKVVTSGGVSLRTCYGYDAQSNRISETSPRANLTVCP